MRAPLAVCVCILTSFLGVVAIAQDRAGQTKEIPLSEIWGYNLPGTKDIAGIPFPDEREGIGQTFTHLSRERDTNIESIRRALVIKPPEDKASPGFVIPRRPDSLALRGVHGPLNRKPGPLKMQLQEGEYTLVFFSHPLSYYTRLLNVERDGNEITVHYQFEPHTTPEATVHFALIPLGELTAGDYQVTYTQTPIEQKYRDTGFEPVHPEAAEIVCRDFSFTVNGPIRNKPLIEGATFIPLHEVWAYEMPGTRDANELDEEDNPIGTSHPLISSLHRTIARRFKEKAGPAFVVEGTGRAALENMVVALNDEPPRYVPAGNDSTLVFYTRFGGHYAHLESVERIGNKFVLTFRFVTHASYNASFHFALIPVGELPAGTYEVEINQSPPIDSKGRRVTLDKDFSSVVCQGTTFYVKEREP